MSEKIATRVAYGQTLAELGKEYPNLVVLDADLSGSTQSAMFAKAFPERFYNMGIAEANMTGVAAGLAACGKMPFTNSFAMFATGRAYEQIRNSVAYPRLNVKIVGSHGGLSVGEDGATHQCNEDIALMRTIPGMTILNPADDVEAQAAVLAAAQYEGPVYLRFGRLAAPVFNGPDYKFQMGKGVTLREGSDLTILATGILVYESLQAAEALAKEGISARVINIHTIKPLDKELVVQAARETGVLLTAEEHSVIGGLGAAVAEAIGEECPVPVVRVGIKDSFGHSGKGGELLAEYGLCSENIAAEAKRALTLKK